LHKLALLWHATFGAEVYHVYLPKEQLSEGRMLLRAGVRQTQFACTGTGTITLPEVE